MKVYICFTAIETEARQRRAMVTNSPEVLRRLHADLERNAQIWKAWVLNNGGQLLALGANTDWQLEIETEFLPELQRVLEQSESLLDTRLAVGLGKTLDDAQRAREASRLTGGRRHFLWGPEAHSILEAAKEDDDSARSSPGLKKTESRAPDRETWLQLMHAHADAHDEQKGLDPALRTQILQILQGLKAQEGELAILRQQNPEIWKSLLASIQAMIAMARGETQTVQKSETPEPPPDPLLHIVENTSASAWNLPPRKMRGAKPGMVVVTRDQHDLTRWRATVLSSSGIPVTHLIAPDYRQALERARKLGADMSAPVKTQPLKKAGALEAGKTGRHLVILPAGSQVDASPVSAHKSGRIKVRLPGSGKTLWRQVRANQVQAPDGTPTSSRNPNPKSSEPPEPAGSLWVKS